MGRIKENQKCAIEHCENTFPRRSNKVFCSLKCRVQSFRDKNSIGRYMKYSELCSSCREKALEGRRKIL